MNLLPSELRLAVFLIVNAILFAGSRRFVSRITRRSGVRLMLDTLLLNYLVQYVAVCALGLLGILSAGSLYALGAATGAALFFLPLRTDTPAPPAESPSDDRSDRLFILLGALFLIGYFAGLIYTEGLNSTGGDDALIYHLPIAARWLREHHLSFFATWFANPANSYSPLAIETFIAWLMAPVGNDLLDHFVQMPALLLIYFAGLEVLDAIGVRPAIAVLVTIAAILSRPFISQSILVKDDLFVGALFITIVAGSTRQRISDRLSAWRIGAAMGLFFAMKYTVVETAPLFLLLIDAPFRARWKIRSFAIAIGTALLLAGPWYLRNLILTGNPLYPVPLSIGGVQIFSGLFFPLPIAKTRTLSGALQRLSGGYQGLAPALVWIGLISILLTMFSLRRRMRTDPIARIVALGAPLGIILFLFFSHAAELRYANPSFILMFLACAIAISTIPLPVAMRIAVAAALAAACIWNGFISRELVLTFSACGTIAAIAGLIYHQQIARRLNRRTKTISVALASVLLAGVIYVYWNSMIVGQRANMLQILAVNYPDLGPAWEAALRNTPPDAIVAYTNLALVRPMMGADYSHPIIYIPTRPGIRWPHDLPPSNIRLTDPQFRPYITGLLMSDSSRPMWLDHLLASSAQTLIIGKTSYMPEPPELGFAEQDPAHFRRVFDDPGASVYRIVR